MAQFPALQRFTDAYLGDRAVRASRQNSADRARVDRAIVNSAMPSHFAPGEMMHYDKEAPDVTICIVSAGHCADKSEPSGLLESGIQNDDTAIASAVVSDLAITSSAITNDDDVHPSDFDALFAGIYEAFHAGASPQELLAPIVEAAQIALRPQPLRIVPKRLPRDKLGLALAGLGAEEDTRGPLFGCTREHRAAQDMVLAGVNRIGADDLARLINEEGIKAPNLDHVSAILKLRTGG